MPLEAALQGRHNAPLESFGGAVWGEWVCVFWWIDQRLLTFASADSKEMTSRQGARASPQDLHLGREFPSGRVDLRLTSLPSDVMKIVSPAGRFLIWLYRRRFCSMLAAS